MKKILFLTLSLSLLIGCGVQGLIEEAEIKRVSGKTEDALELYTRAIKQDPNSLEAYEKRGNIYSKLKIYDNAVSDYRDAARIAETKLNDKTKAADFYYMAALNRSIDNLESRLSQCFLVSTDMDKACQLGQEEACSHACATQPLPVAPTITAVDFKVEAINYPKVNGKSEIMVVLKPMLVGENNKNIDWSDYTLTIDLSFGDDPKVATVVEKMKGKTLLTIQTDKVSASDNNKPLFVSGKIELPNGTTISRLAIFKTPLNKTVSVPL